MARQIEQEIDISLTACVVSCCVYFVCSLLCFKKQPRTKPKNTNKLTAVRWRVLVGFEGLASLGGGGGSCPGLLRSRLRGGLRGGAFCSEPSVLAAGFPTATFPTARHPMTREALSLFFEKQHTQTKTTKLMGYIPWDISHWIYPTGYILWDIPWVYPMDPPRRPPHSSPGQPPPHPLDANPVNPTGTLQRTLPTGRTRSYCEVVV